MGDFSGCYIKVLYTLCRNQKQIYEIIKNNGPTLFASITHHVKSVAHFLFATKEKKNKLRSHVALTFGYKTVLAAHALLATFPLLDLVCWRTFCVAVFPFFFHLLHLLWNNNNSQGAKDICALISHCPLHPAFL